MIQRTSATNFQSWANLEYPFEPGVSLIDGFNYDDNVSEGSGKSAVLNATCWCFYGKLPKEAKVDEVIKDGEKHCIAKVDINHPLIQSIYRSRGPNELGMLDINGKVVKGKDARETQKMIEDVIGMSFDTFCQTVYFAQNFNKKFVTASQEDRGKIFSEIQDLSVFERGRKEAHNLAKIEEKKVVSLQHDLEANKIKYNANLQMIEQQRGFIHKQKQDLDMRIQVARNQVTQKEEVQKQQEQQELQLLEIANSAPLDSLQNDLSELELVQSNLMAEIAQIQGQKSNLNDTNKMRESIKKDLSAYRYRKEKLAKQRRELVEFIQNPQDICNACGTNLGNKDTSHAQQQLEGVDNELAEEGKYANEQEKRLEELPLINVEQLDAQIVEKNNTVNQLKSAMNNIKSEINKITEALQKVQAMAQIKAHTAKDIELLQQQLQGLQNTIIDENPEAINVLNTENEQIQETMVSLDSLLTETRVRLQRLETLKGGFKEVKSYTFNSVLNELTARANKYLVDLFEMPISMKFTNENMKIGLALKIGGVDRSFGLFSGGQQKRIQLATDLALSDIVAARTGTGMNLLILDEYFKDLSEASMHKILTLLETLGRPTILIEHNSIFKSIVNRTFEVELRNGTTTMVS